MINFLYQGRKRKSINDVIIINSCNRFDKKLIWPWSSCAILIVFTLNSAMYIQFTSIHIDSKDTEQTQNFHQMYNVLLGVWNKQHLLSKRRKYTQFWSQNGKFKPYLWKYISNKAIYQSHNGIWYTFSILNKKSLYLIFIT
jgi:hypothetical protein